MCEQLAHESETVGSRTYVPSIALSTNDITVTGLGQLWPSSTDPERGFV